MLHQGKRHAWLAALPLLMSLFATATASAMGPAGKPAYLWLLYADGKSRPDDVSCCDGVPPEFKCSYGATTGREATTDAEECKRRVQDFLNLWYADFNLVFTLTRPPGRDYYPIIITSDGAWCRTNVSNLCNLTDAEAGVAPFNCSDNQELAAYAFECGYSAHDCATMIAHEHAHLVGLEHTQSPSDIMNPTIMPTAVGFDDRENRTVVDPEQTTLTCQATQNSYQQMLAALGRWQGSAKPSPFASVPDAGVADAPVADADDASHTSGSVGPNPGPMIDGGGLVALPGYDALVRPPLATVDASGQTGGSAGGGCSLANRPIPPAALVVALLYLGAAWLIRARGRRARHAAEPLLSANPSRSPSPDPTRGRG